MEEWMITKEMVNHLEQNELGQPPWTSELKGDLSKGGCEPMCGEQKNKKKNVSSFSLFSGEVHLLKHSYFAYTVDFLIEAFKMNYITLKY
jgi:hypothetical protein